MDRPCITPRSLRRLYRVLVPGLLLRVRDCTCSGAMDLGPVNAPPPLDHRQSGVGWSTCGPIGLGRYAQQDRVRVKPGETYRQPQATSNKLDSWSRMCYCRIIKEKVMKRIKHNDLTHYFLRDHRELPAGYLRSCRKFFKSLKPQAGTGHKRQAPGSKLDK